MEGGSDGKYAQYTLYKYRKLAKNKHHFKMPNGMPKGLRLFEPIDLGRCEGRPSERNPWWYLLERAEGQERLRVLSVIS